MTMKEELIFFLMFLKVIFQMIDTLKSNGFIIMHHNYCFPKIKMIKSPKLITTGLTRLVI